MWQKCMLCSFFFFTSHCWHAFTIYIHNQPGCGSSDTFLHTKHIFEQQRKWTEERKVRHFFLCWAADSICHERTVPWVFHIVNTNAPSSSSLSLHWFLALQNSPEVQRICRGDQVWIMLNCLMRTYMLRPVGSGWSHISGRPEFLFKL